ncbi:MAG TPA: hypothetical protein VFQ61_09705 [Polyangiaceae bacterium]|nr:hypothetical protein [Polyangiaceae bacterium]
MDLAEWRSEVARLLEESAAALRNKSDRKCAVAFGTALGYLEKARARGDVMANTLLAQFVLTEEDSTQRFTFAPGELEALNPKKTER